jgi:hypothetical protein
MTTHENEPGHGHSIAAWSAVIVAIIGVTIATLGVWLGDNTMTIAGSVVTVLSIGLGPVLAKLGFGVAGKSTPTK